MPRQNGARFREFLRKLNRLMPARMRRLFLGPEADPEDPYAYVGAPKKPRPPLRGSAATAELD